MNNIQNKQLIGKKAESLVQIYYMRYWVCLMKRSIIHTIIILKLVIKCQNSLRPIQHAFIWAFQFSSFFLS